MSEKVKKLKAARAEIAARMRNLLDSAEMERRGLTEEEESTYDNLDIRLDALNDEIESAQNELRAIEYGAPLKPEVSSSIEKRNHFALGDKVMNRKITDKRNIIYDKRTLQREVEVDNYRFDANGTDLRHAFNRYLLHGPQGISNSEYRALQADLDIAGGYLKMPVEMAKSIIVALDNILHIRQRATTFQLTTSDTFRIPELAHDVGSPTWSGEITAVSEDSDMDFSGRDFTCHPLARLIKVSNKLLRLSSLNPEKIVENRLLAVASSILENNYLNGDGVGKPLGVFVPSANGLPASRDVVASGSTTFSADDLVSVEGALKQQYRRNAAWLMGRSQVERAKKLKDGEGNYLLNRDLAVNGLQTLMGYPVLISEYCPNTFISGNYVLALGDFSFYYIIDNLNMQIQRLTELFSLTNQVGLLFRYEGDGNVADKNAFVRLRLA